MCNNLIDCTTGGENCFICFLFILIVLVLIKLG